jgi:hypothetical protein
MVGSITTLRPLISANVRRTARRSAPWKSSDTGCPVKRVGVWPAGGDCGCATAAAAAGTTGLDGSDIAAAAGAGAATGTTAIGAGDTASATGTGSGAETGVTSAAGAVVTGGASDAPPKMTRSSSPSDPADSTRNGT